MQLLFIVMLTFIVRLLSGKKHKAHGGCSAALSFSGEAVEQ
jgi:hypothetical protein